MKKYVWLYISNDKYELPLYIADTATELGKFLGLSRTTIYFSYSKYLNNKAKTCRFRKVYIGDI